MSNNENSSITSELVMGDSITGETPAGQTHTEEETSETQENDTPTEEVQTESEESKAYNAGSVKAQRLGESRRKLAKALIESAKSNPKASEELKRMIDSDKDLSKYFQKHWSSEYNNIVKNEWRDEEPQTIDEEDVKFKARAELLAEEIREHKRDTILDHAERLGLNKDEADELIELTETFEGKKVGGKELSLEEAIKKAALVVREDKAKAAFVSVPKGENTAKLQDDYKKNANLESLAAVGQRFTGRKKSDIIAGLQAVDKKIKNNVFYLTDED